MKKTNKKGFTIVELVIVIAVIAILSAVLIPTFGGIIETANQSAAVQEANAAYKEAFADIYANGKIDSTDGTIDTDGNLTYEKNDDYKMVFTKDGTLKSIALTEENAAYTFAVDADGVISIAE